ncbi:hypothetical protein [Limnofasciculus baicalensis]|uniref:Uncharacterized protein n=1 Tax=Limnofasciculus baicalensis BBK-W-15 TaxID=2699891 RepID=A0AAE3KNU7_9CYAN|nr:hypothetical protein [Limnofasciculus baicalensis]MCP2729028.1 hypothetical protein [Limnofasciculus baicalensis BBK-W-15]
MKILPSSIIQNDLPLPDGMDLALAFASANQQSIEDFIAKQKADGERVESELQGLQTKKAYLPGAIIAGISAILLPFSFQKTILLPLSLGGMAGGGYYAYLSHKKQQQQILELETEKQAIPQRQIPQVVSHLGKLHYVVNIMPFEDGKLVVDATGIQPKQPLLYPEIPNSINRLQDLSEKLAEIPEELPILLPPTGETDLQDRSRLTGIEADMGEVLSITNQIFTDTVDVLTDIPAFSANHNIVHSLRLLSPHLQDGQPQLHLAQEDPGISRAVQSLAQTNAEAAQAQQLGAINVESMMNDAVERMDSCITHAKVARDRSLMNILSDGLDRIRGVYDYPLTRFYCPKCHQVEQYRTSQLPVAVADLTEVPPDTLDLLHRSEDLRRLRGIMDNIRRYLNQAKRQGEDLNAEHFIILQDRLKTYEELMGEMAVEIPEYDPKIELHKRNAILKYNTLRQEWICQLCSESFNDEQAQWARMIKVKDDLILPIWDALWLEKHDERNRIIREKEAELRENVEEEVAKLREEAKLFTEEFRPVRDKLENMGSSSRVAQQQIDMMLNFYLARGILSQATAAGMRQYINTGQGQTTKEIINITRQLETQLAEEAEAAQIRRSQLGDYADEVRNATKYFLTPPESEQKLIDR